MTTREFEPLRLPERERLLLGPGPSMVAPEVYEALGHPIVGHLDPEFLALMDSIQERLRAVFRTENRLTLAVSGTGSAGMEAAVANLLEPGDEALVLVAGLFGGRICEMVERAGARLHRLERPWGESFEPAEVAAALDRHPGVGLVAAVHAETSTGALQAIEPLGALCRERGQLLVVDAVTSLGGLPLEVDRWAIDACYSGTQKCLSCPPGLAPITFGPRAVAKLRARTTPVRSWYLDLSLIDSYWTGGERRYHHTAPISMNYALAAALDLVLGEGLEPRWRRHARAARALVAGLEALGCEPVAAAGRRLATLTAVRVPAGVDEAAIRRRLLEEHSIEIGGGLGELAGAIWRVGLMGESARRRHVLTLLAALEELLGRSDGAAVAAAERSI